MTGEATMPAGSDGASDIFLHVEGRGGAIRGEATTEGHVDDIDVRSWQWGVASGSAIGSGAATARRSYRHLVVVKGVDRSSVALFTSLINNVELRQVALTMRKAGGDALDYFRMELGQARVVDIDIHVDEGGRSAERVSFSFQRVLVGYTPQQGSGIGEGESITEDTFLPS
ncbi:MAG TPA: type VI secretion system tube protein Hcp [Albitalea sp.]|uniref:Hcp family type VI secretion system effector n=1 Tax=Piscinibacter sp. TaxID=1903157 RepID=UPI002ED61989